MGNKVIGFYGASKEFGEFSNFWASSPPFDFVLPEYARHPDLPDKVSCEFSEKAIMLVKAALMKDRDTFMKVVQAKDPKTTKALGRAVSPWDQELWDAHLEDVAFEVVRQKFGADDELRRVLLSTGDHVLAEATRNDSIWGIGLNVGDPRVQCQSLWRGRNVLGFALMKTRDHLRGLPAVAGGPASRVARSRGWRSCLLWCRCIVE